MEAHYLLTCSLQCLERIFLPMASKPKSSSTKHPVPAAITSPKIKLLAGEALEHPSKMTADEVRSLGASVLAHIEPRTSNKKP
jgi:hypothetical protein